MRKIKNIFTLISIFLLGIGLLGAVLGLRYAILLNARHHLLCEVLQPGMPESEVLAVLEQAGRFTMSRGEWPGGLVSLGIYFTDIKGRILYGSFRVVFSDFKYMRAVVSRGSDKPEYICDFYQHPISNRDTETMIAACEAGRNPNE